MNAMAILRNLPALRGATASAPAPKSPAAPGAAAAATFDATATCRVCGFTPLGGALCQCAQVARDLLGWLGAEGPKTEREIVRWHWSRFCGRDCAESVVRRAEERLGLVLVDLRQHGLISRSGERYAKVDAEPAGWIRDPLVPAQPARAAAPVLPRPRTPVSHPAPATSAGPATSRGGTAPLPVDPERPLLVLVSCSDEKRNLGFDESAPASTVYTSSLFRMSLEYARTLTADDHIRILSAKWGAIGVDEFITKYDMRLHSLGKRDREAWGARVVADLLTEFGRAPLRVVILAGEKYVEAIRAGVGWESARWRIELPFGNAVGERLRVGERLQWLRGQLQHAGSPARLAEAGEPAPGSPEEDLAAIVTFLRQMAKTEATRVPTHHRPQPHQDRIAEVLRQAGERIQRRRLNRYDAITYLRALAEHGDDGIGDDDTYLAFDRLFTAAKGIERGKHLAALRAQRPAPTEASPS
jgi:hypothetical protein